MKILFASAEVKPFSKVGGLADVVGSLPKYIEKEAEIAIFTPLYGCIDKEKYKVIPEPFEDVKRLLSPNYYDIAITSPPYYDLEIYDSSEMQSVVRNKSFNKWIDDFYYPYLANMIYAIKVNGYVVIYIEDIKSKKVNYPLRSITLDYMNNNDEVTYYNMIGLKVGKTVRWALIWKKIKESEK